MTTDLAVVITARVAGARLRETLDAVAQQRPGEPFALIVLDATPDGLDARALPAGVTLLRATGEADEASLRNAALDAAPASLVALLDGEATPQGSSYLASLFAALRADPALAVVQAAQEPHPSCDALGRRLLAEREAALEAAPRRFAIEDGDAGWKKYAANLAGLIALELSCAAVRRTAWEENPVRASPPLDDEGWARDLLEGGWAKAFLPEARVQRSYSGPLRARLRRLRAQASARRKLRAGPLAALPKPAAPQRPERSALLTAAARLAHGGARAAEVLRDEGADAVFGRLRRRSQSEGDPKRAPNLDAPWWERHPYDLIRERRHPVPPPRAEALSGPLTINWVVPAFYAGAGGHMTIFRLVRQLEERGHSCQLIFTSPEGLPQAAVQVRDLVRRLFQPIEARCLLWRGRPLPHADVHVATHWDTAYVVERRRRAGAGAYLVQDWEPGFFPTGTGSALVEETYRLGLWHLCAGAWLEERLRAVDGARASAFALGVDSADYFPDEHAAAPPQAGRIAVYLRPATPRRGFEIVALALAELKRQRPAVEIAAYGCDPRELSLPFEASPRGVLDTAQLRALYQGSTLGLSCSLSNYSLVPQEMMACGLPVVEVDAPSTRAAFRDGQDALLAPPTPQGLAAALLRLLDDAGLRRSLRNAGLARVRALSWSSAGAQVETGLRRAIASTLGLDR